MMKRILFAVAAVTFAAFLHLLPMSKPANAAPLGLAPASALAGDAGTVQTVQHWHHHHRRHHHHHGWGHRHHHGWGHHHHYRRHHHHGWGHHHHHHRRHHHF
ncbi:hypothetical protein BK022_20280, partial [Methylorubrum extorquens]